MEADARRHKGLRRVRSWLSSTGGDRIDSGPEHTTAGRRYLVDQFLSSLAINLLSLGLPIMTLQIYDRLLTSPSSGTLTILISGVVVIIFMEMLLRMARSYLNGLAGASFEHGAMCQAMRHLIASDPTVTHRRHASELLSEVNAISRLRDCYSGQVWTTLIDLPFIFVFLGMIAYLAGWLVIAPLVLLSAFTMVAWAIGSSLKDNLLHRDESDDRRYNLMIEALKGIHAVKAHGMEKLFIRRYEALQTQANPLNYQVAQSGGMMANIGILFAQLMMVAVVTTGAPFVMSGEITTGTLIACVLLSGRMMQPVQRGLSLWTRIQDFHLAHRKVEAIMDVPVHAPNPQSRHAQREGILICRDVHFHHPGSDTKLLDGISLTVRRGESVAITGAHSGGKSSFLQLLGGLYVPDSGTVTVDGYAPCSYRAEDLLAHVGYLPPDGTIYRGTIMDNMTGFRDEKRAAAREIAELLGLSDAVARLPLGYETLLEGAVADAIPPGVKQRIAIGRVLIDKPRVLLFDHADRALDREGYNHVFRLLGRLRPRAALILVSDDRNLLSLADRVVRLENGKLEDMHARQIGVTPAGNWLKEIRA